MTYYEHGQTVLPDGGTVHWANDAGHVFLFGRTQTGKTTTAKEMFAESERVNIWVNQRGDDRVEGVKEHADGSYRSLQGVKNAFSRDEARIEYLPADYQQGIVKLRQWLWTVADRTDRQLPVTVYADEFQHVAWQTGKDDVPSRDAVRKFTAEGMKRNIKFVGITQDPVKVDKVTIRQRDYMVCFALSAEQSDYLGDYGANVSEINAQEDYAGVVYHADGSIVEKGVKAKERYA